ncbi:MAG: class I SAM-dependent methyltransferase [Mailhella sp.]|nr:class I SAM-dependent methyltransferase [Mailhella sp.]
MDTIAQHDSELEAFIRERSFSPFDRVFQSCGRMWHIRRADMDRLWESMGTDAGGEERLPYWNEVWPSSLALAGWIAEMEDDIRGRKCLDMGCGLGFTALMGRWFGADVTGMDYEPEAVEYARLNAEANGIEGVEWRVEDWRAPTLAPGSFDRIWAGDVMYETSFADPVAEFIRTMLKPEGRAWLAEPGREIFRSLLDVLPAHHLSYRRICSLPVSPLTPQEVPVPVTIWELSRTM